jgi:hypothetical protein
MRSIVLLALLLAVAPAVQAVDVVLGGKPVAPPDAATWSSCAPRNALEAGTKLGAPAAPSLSMTRVYVEVRPPARGRVVSLAYPGITSQERTARYAYVARDTLTAATASACAWTGRADPPGN